MSEMVTVFSKPACVQCTMTYKALDKAGVTYTVVDVTENAAALEYVTEDLGYSAAPILVVDERNHRGRTGGRPFKMTPAKVRLAMAAMGQRETKVGDLCKELGITRQTLYRHVSPAGELRSDGARLLSKK